jgi:hypothetical protein
VIGEVWESVWFVTGQSVEEQISDTSISLHVHTSGDKVSPDMSVMEDNIQSLTQELRTKYPKRWTTGNVCPWSQ